MEECSTMWGIIWVAEADFVCTNQYEYIQEWLTVKPYFYQNERINTIFSNFTTVCVIFIRRYIAVAELSVL